MATTETKVTHTPGPWVTAPCEVTERLQAAPTINGIRTVRATYAEYWPTCPVVDGKRFLLVGQRNVGAEWELTYRWVEGGGN